MADLTPDEMACLRVPLTALPGLPCRGLLAYPAAGSVYDDRPFMFETDMIRTDTGRWAVRVLGHNRPVGDWLVDHADAATRDRCARYQAQRVGVPVGSTAPEWYQAQRVGVPVGSTAPEWHAIPASGGWWLTVRGVGCFYPAGASPISGGLDPSDDRRLSDGSRWVDAAALAAVLRGGA